MWSVNIFIHLFVIVCAYEWMYLVWPHLPTIYQRICKLVFFSVEKRNLPQLMCEKKTKLTHRWRIIKRTKNEIGGTHENDRERWRAKTISFRHWPYAIDGNVHCYWVLYTFFLKKLRHPIRSVCVRRRVDNKLWFNQVWNENFIGVATVHSVNPIAPLSEGFFWFFFFFFITMIFFRVHYIDLTILWLLCFIHGVIKSLVACRTR